MKRKRENDGPESSLPAPPASAGLPAPPPPMSDSPLRRTERSRDYDRRPGDRRPGRDPRDDFEDGGRYRRSTSVRLRSPVGSDRQSTPPVRSGTDTYHQLISSNVASLDVLLQTTSSLMMILCKKSRERMILRHDLSLYLSLLLVSLLVTSAISSKTSLVKVPLWTLVLSPTGFPGGRKGRTA
jgi:hypothetical protein